MHTPIIMLTTLFLMIMAIAIISTASAKFKTNCELNNLTISDALPTTASSKKILTAISSVRKSAIITIAVNIAIATIFDTISTPLPFTWPPILFINPLFISAIEKSTVKIIMNKPACSPAISDIAKLNTLLSFSSGSLSETLTDNWDCAPSVSSLN